MTNESVLLDCEDYEAIAALGAPCERPHESRADIKLPAGTVLASMDTHYSLGQDIFYEQIPDRLKDVAPRVWRDPQGGCHLGWERPGIHELELQSSLSARIDSRPGATDIAARVAEMDEVGVQKEIAFPNLVHLAVRHPNFEVRHWCVQIYADHLASLQEKAPGRFYGVGFIDWWDRENVGSSITRLKSLGLKTFLLPIDPGKDKDGKKIHYHADDMIPMWEAIEDSGLPVCFHIGENISDGPRSAAVLSALVSLGPFRKTFGELAFGGILDRHPSLQIVFVEAGINWVPSTLQDAKLVYASYRNLTDYRPKKDIESYWHDHMFATFMVDPLGMKLIDMIGTDKVMWSTDYPHPEGTLGYTWSSIKRVLDAVSPKDAKKILGGTGIKVFNL